MDFKRKALLKQLELLLAKLENPSKLDELELERIKAELADCQRRYKELGF